MVSCRRYLFLCALAVVMAITNGPCSLQAACYAVVIISIIGVFWTAPIGTTNGYVGLHLLIPWTASTWAIISCMMHCSAYHLTRCIWMPLEICRELHPMALVSKTTCMLLLTFPNSKRQVGPKRAISCSIHLQGIGLFLQSAANPFFPASIQIHVSWSLLVCACHCRASSWYCGLTLSTRECEY